MADGNRIYLAGPMTGYKDFNFPAFMDYAEFLYQDGWEVCNPAQHDLDEFGDLATVEAAFKADPDGMMRKCLGWDLAWITANADAIAMMPGWENSRGARAEHATAVALGLQIVYL